MIYSCMWFIHVCDLFICMWFIYMYATRLTVMSYTRDMTNLYADTTHSYAWHDSFMCVTWLIHMCDVIPSYVWHDLFICVTWLIHMCDMTHSYVWQDLFTCVKWLMHVWHDSFISDVTHLYVWHGPFTCDICVWRDSNNWNVWHDAFTCVRFVHVCQDSFTRVTWPIHMYDMTHSYVWHS